MAQELTKDEKKAIRKLEWEKQTQNNKRHAVIKKYSLLFGVTIAVILAVAGLYWVVTAPTPGQTQNPKIAPVSARDIIKDNKNAKVTLIEYADFECPACAEYHTIVDKLVQDYGNKIYYVYRMFPLENAHPHAVASAQAAYAAYKQGAFFQYGDLLFNNQNTWAASQDPTSYFIDYANQLKLDINKFKADSNSAETQKYVKDSENEALKEGITYTPSFFINGQLIQNPSDYNGFKQLIDNALSGQ